MRARTPVHSACWRILTFERPSARPLAATCVFLLACTKGRSIHRRRFLLLRPPPTGRRRWSREGSPKGCHRRCTLPVPQRPTPPCSCRHVRIGRRIVESGVVLEVGHTCSRRDGLFKLFSIYSSDYMDQFGHRCRHLWLVCICKRQYPTMGAFFLDIEPSGVKLCVEHQMHLE